MIISTKKKKLFSQGQFYFSAKQNLFVCSMVTNPPPYDLVTYLKMFKMKIIR